MTFIETYAGHLAGVFASLLWMMTALSFTAAGHRIGTTVVNTIRIFLGLLLLAMTHAAVTGGMWWPEASAQQVWLLAVSGVIGLSLGDQALFASFVYIGPRLGTLIMVTAPIFAAVFGLAFLDEHLSLRSMLGIAITIGGVAWVLLERRHVPEPPEAVPEALETPSRADLQTRRPTAASPQRRKPSMISTGKAASDPKYWALGVGLAFVGSICQAGGSLLSKQGMGHGWLEPEDRMDPLAAAVIRLTFAAIGVLPLLILHAARNRRSPNSAAGGGGGAADDRPALAAAAERRALRRRIILIGLMFTACGTVTGPYLGMWMSLVAFDNAPLGIAQTLLSLTPIFILPVSVLVHHERLTLRAVFGAVIAVIGLSLFFIDWASLFGLA